MTVLVVAEKPSAARRLAEILAEDRYQQGKIGRVPLFELARGGEEWRIVALSGHVVEIDYPEEYNGSWSGTPPRQLVHVDPEASVRRRDFEQALQAGAAGADRIVVATDYDREGELIGLEAIEHVLGDVDVPVQRARFSSLTRDDVVDAFTELEEVDEPLARSAEARRILDLAWGAPLTRFVSLAAKRYGDRFLSVGRVQSPTLALVVDREEKIDAFEPEPYWRLHAELSADGTTFRATHEADRFEDEDAVDAARDAARAAGEGRIVEATREVDRDRGPPPFDTTAFIGAATSRGLSAKQAMDTAETLYNRGLISYPRTDNRVYPDGLDLYDVLGTLTGSGHGGFAREVLDQDRLHVTRGKTESTDHPPIHPTGAASKSDMSKRQWKVYDLVVRRFLATVAEPSVEESRELVADVGGEVFEAEGYRVLERGWRRYYPYLDDSETVLPDVEEGDLVELEDLEKEAKETEPPDRYRDGGLVKAMADQGLGTKSTRHETIQKLRDRGYIRGESIRPTPTGRALIGALSEHAGRVASPELTADLEEQLQAIADGESDLAAVVEASREALDGVFAELEANEEALGRRIREALSEEHEQRRKELTRLGPCPDCDEQLVVRKSKGGRFAGCLGYDEEPRCTTTYNLPNQGGIDPTGEVCEACGTPQIKVLMKDRKPWEICLDMDCEA